MPDIERRELSAKLLWALRPAWVLENFPMSRENLKRWRDHGIPPRHIPALLTAVKGLVAIKEAAPPEWAERLATKDDLAAAIRMLLDLSPQDRQTLADYEAELGRLWQVPGEPAPPGLPD